MSTFGEYGAFKGSIKRDISKNTTTKKQQQNKTKPSIDITQHKKMALLAHASNEYPTTFTDV